MERELEIGSGREIGEHNAKFFLIPNNSFK